MASGTSEKPVEASFGRRFSMLVRGARLVLDSVVYGLAGSALPLAAGLPRFVPIKVVQWPQRVAKQTILEARGLAHVLVVQDRERAFLYGAPFRATHERVVEQLGFATRPVSELALRTDDLEVMPYFVLPDDDQRLASTAEALEYLEHDIAHAKRRARDALARPCRPLCTAFAGALARIRLCRRLAPYHE